MRSASPKLATQRDSNSACAKLLLFPPATGHIKISNEDGFIASSWGKSRCFSFHKIAEPQLFYPAHSHIHYKRDISYKHFLFVHTVFQHL